MMFIVMNYVYSDDVYITMNDFFSDNGFTNHPYIKIASLLFRLVGRTGPLGLLGFLGLLGLLGL